MIQQHTRWELFNGLIDICVSGGTIITVHINIVKEKMFDKDNVALTKEL